MTASMSTAVETQSSELPRKASSKTSEHRRATKPIMEKKRRARINNSLNELKILILDALNKDPSRHSKLEKADILEMTVRHLQSIQRQNIASAIATDPSVLNKYRAGFAECATEVTRYIGRSDGVDQSLRQRLVSHLNNCVTSLNAVPNLASNAYAGGVARSGAAFPGMLPPNSSPYTSNTPLHVQIPLQSAASLTGLFPTNASNARTNVGGDINNNNTSPILTSSTLPIDTKPSLSTPPSSASSTSSSHFNFSLPLQQCSPPIRGNHLFAYHNLNINVSQNNLSEVPSTTSSALLFRHSAINSWNRNSCLESPIGHSSISPSGSSVGSGQLSPCESDHDIDMESENVAPVMSHRGSSLSNDSVWRPW